MRRIFFLNLGHAFSSWRFAQPCRSRLACSAPDGIERLVRFDFAATASKWLREQTNSRKLADALCDLVPPRKARAHQTE
jgi:hypothetical protein